MHPAATRAGGRRTYPPCPDTFAEQMAWVLLTKIEAVSSGGQTR
nr:hypothetical protein [Actinoplanes polyasparticus]